MIYKIADITEESEVTIEFFKLDDGIVILMANPSNEYAGGIVKVTLEDWVEMVKGIGVK